MQSIAWTITVAGGRAAPSPGYARLDALPTCSEFSLAVTLRDPAGGALVPPSMSAWSLTLASDRDGATPPECVASSVAMEAGVATATCDPRTTEMAGAVRARAANGRLPVLARLTGYDAGGVPQWSCSWLAEFFGEAPAGDDLPSAIESEYYTRAEVDALIEGVQPEGGIGAAIEAHNTSPDAHSDILADFALDLPPEEIQSTNVEADLEEGHNYFHAPASAPIYTLPAGGSGARGITVEVEFSASALSVAFLDAEGATVPVLPMAGDIAAGAVVLYVCRWSPALAAWAIMPVLLKEGA